MSGISWDKLCSGASHHPVLTHRQTLSCVCGEHASSQPLLTGSLNQSPSQRWPIANPEAEKPPTRCLLAPHIGEASSNCHALCAGQSLRGDQLQPAPGHSGSYGFYSPSSPLEWVITSPVIKAQQTKNKRSNRSFLRSSPHLHFRGPRNRIPASAGPVIAKGASAPQMLLL